MISNFCFSQTESADTLNKIEAIKRTFLGIGISKLDKIEGIYFGHASFTMSGWQGSSSNLNGTTVNSTYYFIIRSLEIKNRFDIYEYYADDFRPDAGKWFIKKEGNQYFVHNTATSNEHRYYFDEIAINRNYLSYTLKDDYKLNSTNVERKRIINLSKLFPLTLDESIFKTGTGFFISKDGYVVTNYHVIKDATNIYVSNLVFKRLKAQVEFTDIPNDISILKIAYALKSIPYNIISANKDIGDNVFTLGYPYIQSMGKEVKLTNGIINSNSGFENDNRYYQFSAEIQPGNSGGPLFDSEGNIIGLVSAKHNKATNAGYALKSKFLIDFIKMNNPFLLKKNVSTLNKMSFTSKYKILKDYVLLLEVE